MICLSYFNPLYSFCYSGSSAGEESTCNAMRLQFDSWIGKIPWRRDSLPTPVFLGFPCSSAGKESAYNEGDPGSIPGLGRSREGIGYPHKYSWASLVAQLLKNLPAMWETWVQSLSWEDLLEKETATHSNILAQRIPRIV